MEHVELQPLPVANKAALNRVVARLAFTRPAILDATRAIGFSDLDLARMLGCTQGQVSHWATCRRPIPQVKLFAIWLFIVTLDFECFRGDHTRRARILGRALRDLASISVDEAFPDKRIPESIFRASAQLAAQMLGRLDPEIEP